MTNEEAISLLKLKLNWSSTCEQEAIKLAIAALKYNAARTGPGPVAWLIEWPASDNLPARWWSPVRGWCTDAKDATWFLVFEDALDTIQKGCFEAGVCPTQIPIPTHRP